MWELVREPIGAHVGRQTSEPNRRVVPRQYTSEDRRTVEWRRRIVLCRGRVVRPDRGRLRERKRDGKIVASIQVVLLVCARGAEKIHVSPGGPVWRPPGWWGGGDWTWRWRFRGRIRGNRAAHWRRGQVFPIPSGVALVESHRPAQRRRDDTKKSRRNSGRLPFYFFFIIPLLSSEPCFLLYYVGSIRMRRECNVLVTRYSTLRRVSAQELQIPSHDV